MTRKPNPSLYIYCDYVKDFSHHVTASTFVNTDADEEAVCYMSPLPPQPNQRGYEKGENFFYILGIERDSNFLLLNVERLPTPQRVATKKRKKEEAQEIPSFCIVQRNACNYLYISVGYQM